MSTILSIITRAILIFFGRGEDCYEQWRNGIQEVKRGCRLLLFMLVFFYFLLRDIIIAIRTSSRSTEVAQSAWSRMHRDHRLLPLWATIYLYPPPALICVKIIKFIVPPVYLTTHFYSFRPVCCERCVDLVVSLFFFLVLLLRWCCVWSRRLNSRG